MSIETIGLDLGGTKLLAGRLDAQGRILDQRQVSTARDSAGAVLAQMTELVDALRTPQTRAIGVSTLALVDRRTDALGYAGPVPVEGVRLGPVLREATALPVVVENDANTAALAEGRLGAACGAGSAVVIVVGTGIGGGILINGRLHTGARGVAGEVGRIPVAIGRDENGSPLYLRWEDLAAGPALDAMARDGSMVGDSDLARHVAAGNVADGRALVALAEQATGLARSLLDRYAELLVTGVVACAEMFDPEMIVLGGGVFTTGTLLFDRICDLVRSQVLPPGNEVRIARAALGPAAGMVGAGLLAADLFTTDKENAR